MKRNILLVFIYMYAVLSIQSQIINVKKISKEAIQYNRTDFLVQLEGSWDNPYLQEDITVDMLVTSPSGDNLVVPCFYESGESGEVSTWMSRFTPQQVGQYQYQFLLKQKDEKKNTSKKFYFDSKSSKLKGFLHAENDWILKFDNGQPFRGIGENICWESRDNDDSKYFKELHENHNRYNYDNLIPLFSKSGGNFCRVWMCSWNFPIDRKRNFNNDRYTASDEYFNPSAIKKLDQFIDLCEKEDVYIMLCMGQGDVSADRNFFISKESKNRYKNRLRYIVSRWGYSPYIAMWEFFNEIDNIQFRNPETPIPSEDIVAWHTEMSTYLKEIDPYNHIRTTSISHRDLQGLNSIPDIDINQKHIYNNTSVMPSEINKYSKEFNKPYIIGEFGYEWDWSKNFNDFSEGMDFDFKRGLWYGLFTATPVTPMSWWWEYFEDRGMMTYFRGVREINDKMLKSGNGEFEMINVQADGLEAFAVKCGESVFVYLLNNSDTDSHSRINVGIPRFNKQKVKTFNPTSLKYAKHKYVSSSNDNFIIDEINLKARDEMILVISK